MLGESKSFVEAMRALQEKVRVLVADKEELLTKLDVVNSYWEKRVAELLQRAQEESKSASSYKDKFIETEKKRELTEIAFKDYVARAETNRSKSLNDMDELKFKLKAAVQARDEMDEQLRDEVRMRMQVMSERDLAVAEATDFKREITHLTQTLKHNEDKAANCQRAVHEESKSKNEVSAKLEQANAGLNQLRDTYSKASHDRTMRLNMELQQGLEQTQAELTRQTQENRDLVMIGGELRSRVEVLSEELRTKCVGVRITSRVVEDTEVRAAKLAASVDHLEATVVKGLESKLRMSKETLIKRSKSLETRLATAELALTETNNRKVEAESELRHLKRIMEEVGIECQLSAAEDEKLLSSLEYKWKS